MQPGPPRRRRPRPVADAPVNVLLDRSEDLAKGWLLALLEQAPLDEAPRILASDLTRDGPRICEAVLRAVASDSDLRRLEPGGALVPLTARVGLLAGAAGAEATAQAVDALQSVLWSALRSELRDPDPELVSELAERLAQVTALLRSAALRAGAGEGTGSRGPALAAVRPTAPAGTDDPTAAGVDGPGLAGVDGPSLAGVDVPTVDGVGHAPGGPDAAAEPRLRAWVGSGPAPPEPPQALWVGALNEEIRRAGSQPLSLLLAELEDADRVLAVESEAGSTATFSAFAQGVRQAVRRQDILVCETASRAWVIARDTARPGARALGERISAAVREGRPWRGAPLATSVGIAVLGEDGRSPAELIEAAEEARFVASAGGPA